MDRGKRENLEKCPRCKNQQQIKPTYMYGTALVSKPGHISGKQALSPLLLNGTTLNNNL